ncbi:alpha-ketoglutarate-dependent dioxygenase AlkB [Gemmatimonas sp.]|uniref:alpha-ketoglutarate-dependent dioxygenase AlkB n=1 Tax=Gemmatimonas sp. TaxID=1962908 RepID=UPI003563BCEA
MNAPHQQALDLGLPALDPRVPSHDPPSAESVPGLDLRTRFIGEDLEVVLVGAIDSHPWMTSMSRRVQHYGWRYDYRSRRVPADAYLGPLPNFLDPVLRRLQSELGFKPDQAIVNEYEPGQGIAPHVDCLPCFGPRLAMLSLCSDVQMDFSGPGNVDSSHPLLFPKRSLVVLDREARSEWMHSIAKRKSDPRFNLTRARRISITFRTVVPAT